MSVSGIISELIWPFCRMLDWFLFFSNMLSSWGFSYERGLFLMVARLLFLNLLKFLGLLAVLIRAWSIKERLKDCIDECFAEVILFINLDLVLV